VPFSHRGENRVHKIEPKRSALQQDSTICVTHPVLDPLDCKGHDRESSVDRPEYVAAGPEEGAVLAVDGESEQRHNHPDRDHYDHRLEGDAQGQEQGAPVIPDLGVERGPCRVIVQYVAGRRTTHEKVPNLGLQLFV
jgi:hypothetical protein